ncbi:MAG: dihydrodipicolinate synthase family protein [Acidobacteria bacterium]|nr:dihydrodipicolinate synthase family protein [Acidobacteriota bacterium]
MKLHGIFPPITTPFSSDGALALDALRENVARYNRIRLGGYVVVGSTGESVLLSFEETERVWETVLEAAAPGKTLIAGTGVEATKETIERTNRAAALGYQVALVRTPHYYKPQMTPAVELEHFLRVADTARIPVLIYSVPQFTGLAVEADTVARLAEHPNIIGIKESSGNVQRVAEIIHATPRSFQTLVGSASTLYPSLALGAVGAILAVACVLPELCVELYEASRAGDTERASTLQDRLLAPTLKLVAELGIPGIKYAMDWLSYYGGPARRPLLPLTDAQKREVETVLAAVAPVSAPGK